MFIFYFHSCFFEFIFICLINNFIFYSPFNISSPKEIKNIFFFSSIKSNKSYKPDDFSFTNKYNNYDNLYFLHQKNQNSIISDMSYDKNL